MSTLYLPATYTHSNLAMQLVFYYYYDLLYPNHKTQKEGGY